MGPRIARGAVSLGMAAALFAACSQAKSARQPGDDLTVDNDASTLPPQPDAGNYDDGFFAPLDAPFGTGYGTADAYAVLTVCAPPDASTADASTSGGTAAGSSASTGGGASADAAWGAGQGGSYGAGSSGPCTPIPAACVSDPSCPCLLTAFASTLPCTYPHCDLGTGFSIYCP